MLLQPNKGSEKRRNRGRREINEHFNLDMIEIDRWFFDLILNLSQKLSRYKFFIKIDLQLRQKRHRALYHSRVRTRNG